MFSDLPLAADMPAACGDFASVPKPAVSRCSGVP
jgi:hypothetical protein